MSWSQKLNNIAASFSTKLYNSEFCRFVIQSVKRYSPPDWRYPETWKQPSEELLSLIDSLPVNIRSQRNSYTCGPACIDILLSHYGHHLKDDQIELLAETTKSGTRTEIIVDTCKRLGFNPVEKSDASVQDIITCLSMGRPVLVNYQAFYTPRDAESSDNGHYSVIIGADDRDFLLADPSKFNPINLRTIPIDAFYRIWWDISSYWKSVSNRWMMYLDNPCSCS